MATALVGGTRILDATAPDAVPAGMTSMGATARILGAAAMGFLYPATARVDQEQLLTGHK
jgi:hypothetical protein